MAPCVCQAGIYRIHALSTLPASEGHAPTGGDMSFPFPQSGEPTRHGFREMQGAVPQPAVFLKGPVTVLEQGTECQPWPLAESSGGNELRRSLSHCRKRGQAWVPCPSLLQTCAERNPQPMEQRLPLFPRRKGAPANLSLPGQEACGMAGFSILAEALVPSLGAAVQSSASRP